MASKTSLRSMSTKQIAAELRRRKAYLAKLNKRRAALIARVERLDRKIGKVGNV